MTTSDARHEDSLDVIRSLAKSLEASQRETARLRKEFQREVSRLVTMVEGLTQQLDLLLRERDEERRAELAKTREEAQAMAAAAAAMAGDESPSPEGSGGPSPTGKPSKKPKRHAHGRKPKPDHLERETVEQRPEACAHCQSEQLVARDDLVTEEYDYIRAHVRIRRTVRKLCVCTECNRRTVPDAPPMPFERASATFSMVAWLCFAKGGMFVPLDRLGLDLARQGASIPSATLTRWWQRGADLLQPIAEAVRQSLLAETHIRTDGTGLRVVLCRRKGKPVKGEERVGETDAEGWLLERGSFNGQILVFGNDEHAVYWFTETKEGHHAMDFLTLGKDAQGRPLRWKGTLTADALSAHDCLFVDGERTESGCNAHGLRKFRDHADKAPLLASKAMGFLGGFYRVEAEAKQRKLVCGELLAYRRAHAGPIADNFKAWLDEHLDALLDTNPVRKAMNYYVKHWTALTRFLEDPKVELDNNWSERALRKVALLRNNSLYAGGVEGAVRLCTLFTLINTCRLLGLDPYAYLVWAMTRSVPHATNRGLRSIDLTPAAYKASQQQAA